MTAVPIAPMPWRVDEAKDSLRGVFFVRAADGRAIMTMNSGVGEPYVFPPTPETIEFRTRHATLAAAAPDLLAASEAAIEVFDGLLATGAAGEDDGWVETVRFMLRTAVDKANTVAAFTLDHRAVSAGAAA